MRLRKITSYGFIAISRISFSFALYHKYDFIYFSCYRHKSKCNTASIQQFLAQCFCWPFFCLLKMFTWMCFKKFCTKNASFYYKKLVVFIHYFVFGCMCVFYCSFFKYFIFFLVWLNRSLFTDIWLIFGVCSCSLF